MKYFTSWLQTIVQLFLSSIMPIMKNAVKMIIRVKSVEQGWLDFSGGNFRNTFFREKGEIFLNTSESKQKCVSCARNGTLKLRTRRIPFHLFFSILLDFYAKWGKLSWEKNWKTILLLLWIFSCTRCWILEVWMKFGAGKNRLSSC